MELEQIDLDAFTFQHIALEEWKNEHTFSVSGSGIACGSSNVPASSNVNDDRKLIGELDGIL